MNKNVCVIQSAIDDDLYKLTMQQAVLMLYPDAKVEYKFKNRGTQKFTKEFESLLKEQIELVSELKTTEQELSFLKSKAYFKPWYIDFLRSFHLDKDEVAVYVDTNGNLEITITGYWYKTIRWEVVLMAIISELYFKDEEIDLKKQDDKLAVKTSKLMSAGCDYIDFGTRRRRNFLIQDRIVNKMKNHHWFGGTSNPYLAMKYDVPVVGTMAHEWIQGISALESMNHPNRFMLEKWTQVYGTDLSVALTDTFGTKSFLKDFDKKFAYIFAGVRHDSADPFEYTDKIINHYKSLDIDYTNKVITFSDSLTADKAVKIKEYCNHVNIKSKFGIGTSFTNDFDTPALNMVIKLSKVNGFDVVKLSDEEGKNNGESNMIEIMKRIHL